MAAKYQLITELYRRTGVAIAKNPQAWQSFLSAACRNYKCRFDEQQVTVNLPTVEEQIEMLAEAEDEKSSAFVISQEDIDSVLQRGSGFQNGKYRIYRQLQKNEDSKGNLDFLKKEYGTGGGTHYFPDGTQGHTWHDGKGIAI